jgi:hypothetical protein
MASNNVIISTNEILEAGAYYSNRASQSSTMKTLIKQNILEDYSLHGVRDCEVSCFFSNFKNESGTIQKKWVLGQFIKVGNVIQINGKNEESEFKNRFNNVVPYRVLSRQITYDGAPKLILKCQEIKI